MENFIEENTLFFTELSKELFATPELGFKEFETKKKIIDVIKAIGNDIKIEESSITGFKATIGNGEVNIGVVAELDAVYCPEHFCANPTTCAAHNCGHYSQVTIVLFILKYVYEHQSHLKNKFTFIFTPAEEFLDLEYRNKLIEDGQIESISGKINMILDGFVEDIDAFISMHSMLDNGYKHGLGTDLITFDFIDVDFYGVASHAGMSPEKGINALDEGVLFYQFLRKLESSLTYNLLRLNPIIESEKYYNVVCPKATVSTYLRVSNMNFLEVIYEKIDEYLKEREIKSGIKTKLNRTVGYSGFKQSKYLNKMIEPCFESLDPHANTLIFAGGDIGDFSILCPTIQIGYAGFVGSFHGDDFKESDTEYLYGKNVEQFINAIMKIDNEIEKTKLYKRSKDEYYKIKFEV